MAPFYEARLMAASVGMHPHIRGLSNRLAKAACEDGQPKERVPVICDHFSLTGHQLCVLAQE